MKCSSGRNHYSCSLSKCVLTAVLCIGRAAVIDDVKRELFVAVGAVIDAFVDSDIVLVTLEVETNFMRRKFGGHDNDVREFPAVIGEEGIRCAQLRCDSRADAIIPGESCFRKRSCESECEAGGAFVGIHMTCVTLSFCEVRNVVGGFDR